MQQSGVRSILVNTLFLSGARFTTILARLIYAIVIAKLLGPELYGLFNYGLSWYLIFMPLSVIGTDFVLLRELGRYDNNDELLNTSLALRGISCVMAACLCLGIGWTLESEDQMRSLLFVFSIALVGRGLSAWTNSVFKGYESSHYVLKQELLFRLLEVILGIVLLTSGYNLLALAMVHATSWLLQGIIGVAIIRKFLHPTIHPRWDVGIMIDLVKRGSPFLGAAFLLGWLLQGPLVLFRHLSKNDIALGQLALSLQVFVLIGSIVAELSTAALPVLSRSVKRQDGKTSQFVIAIFHGGWLLSGILIIAALTIGGWAVELLFGTGFKPVETLLPWATAMVGPFFWCNNLRSVLAAQGQYGAVFWSNLTGAVIFTMAFFPSCAYFGTFGVFIALGLGFVILVSIQFWGIRHTDPLGWIKSVVRPLIVISIAVLGCQVLMPMHPWYGLIFGLSTLCVASLATGLFSLREIRTVFKSLM
ncbi:MAG: oligosaccharide flippase family protein [Deltaproteobacteria bacterium]|nr:oligosaccharide flippase family protein [Deltaproteobacteria bacterium]